MYSQSFNNWKYFYNGKLFLINCATKVRKNTLICAFAVGMQHLTFRKCFHVVGSGDRYFDEARRGPVLKRLGTIYRNT